MLKIFIAFITCILMLFGGSLLLSFGILTPFAATLMTVGGVGGVAAAGIMAFLYNW